MIFKKAELFAGAGGLSLGMKMARGVYNGIEYGIEQSWSNDFNEDACNTFIHNICPDNPESVFCEDVKKLDITDKPSIDAFAFGFPCNDYSIIGKSKGLNGDFGPLYTYGINVLKYHQPKFFIGENVGGLESANGGAAFKIILQDMINAGYTITTHKYKFEEYGIPQARHRIIIIGFRNDLGLKFKVPKATHKEKYKQITSKQALEKPLLTELNNDKTKHQSKVIEMLSYITPGENAWYEGIPDRLRLNVKGAKMSNIYKRLDPNKPAYTVTASGGGGTHMYHYDELRALTNRERARLQTFPDDFKFSGGKESVRKQIGMAVPPLGAKIITEAIFKTFAGVEYETEKAKWDDNEVHSKTN